ncbi:hypothetical protein UFOVP468_51 [uncultured Caudovirales phage]|uniref:Uncharacterized protein n=1 Tax=uncultured Caudovirales phage TaxID=2100421 RepID=A0A6J5MHV1_9CAUD|nr:hypothetical protein UFOVP468_51 [uncultured Caudovirales phage]
MAEDIIEEDDDEELIPVDTPPEDTHDDDDDEGDGEDERLADDADDDPDGDTAVNTNRNKRLKRRQVQKLAKENAQRELRMLRQQNEAMAQRLAAVEGNALSHNEMAIDARIDDAENAVRSAEHIIARAVESGNGDDVTSAIRMRDEALSRAHQLKTAKQQVSEARNRPVSADPAAINLAKEWMAANPWYDVRGNNEDSAVTNAIDARLVVEGFNPASVEYWQELTNRLRNRVAPAARTRKAPEGDGTARKKAPPMGNTREHAPQSTKKEVYVTPDRKQAMIEAGYWDDPVKRNQMLKAYQAHDRNSAR